MDVSCFTEHEWMPVDFHVIRVGVSSFAGLWFRNRFVCVRTLVEQGEGSEVETVPVGYLMIWEDELRRWYKGETEVLQKFGYEEDRVAVLREHFGIVLTEDEQNEVFKTGTYVKGRGGKGRGGGESRL